MKVLLDHCLPKRLRTLLTGHEVKTARQMGWEQLKNGALLSSAATQFDVFLTIDKRLQFESNLATIPVAVGAVWTARDEVARSAIAEGDSHRPR